MTHFKETLTEEQKEKLKQFDNAVNNTLYLTEGDAVDWEFDATKYEEVTNTKYPDSPQIKFRVYDPNLEGEFDAIVSMAAARQITPKLRQGITFLHIERHGKGSDTRYVVEEAK